MRSGSLAVPLRRAATRRDGDAVDVEVGLGPQHVADLGAGGQHAAVHHALRARGRRRRATSTSRPRARSSARPRSCGTWRPTLAHRTTGAIRPAPRRRGGRPPGTVRRHAHLRPRRRGARHRSQRLRPPRRRRHRRRAHRRRVLGVAERGAPRRRGGRSRIGARTSIQDGTVVHTHRRVADDRRRRLRDRPPRPPRGLHHRGRLPGRFGLDRAAPRRAAHRGRSWPPTPSCSTTWRCPPARLALGVPAKIREGAAQADMIASGAQGYVDRTRRYQARSSAASTDQPGGRRRSRPRPGSPRRARRRDRRRHRRWPPASRRCRRPARPGSPRGTRGAAGRSRRAPPGGGVDTMAALMGARKRRRRTAPSPPRQRPAPPSPTDRERLDQTG